MRVALITPYYSEAVRGNALTVQRLERYLRHQGCDLCVFSLDELSIEMAVSTVISGRFDICHAFHAHLGGSVARKIREQSGLPYLITLTGSDVYEALVDGRREDVLANLGSASSVVAFHKVVGARLAMQAPDLAAHIVVIPQGVDPPAIDDVLAESGESDEFIFLLPAGIRPVKNLLFPLKPLAELHRQHPEVRFQIAGPVLNQEYAAQLFSMLPDYPFARYLGVVGHPDMDDLYRKAAVVLNTSHFEGGMANSLLEAMSWEKPVLASDIEGNRSLVTDGVNGLLYRNTEEFINKAELLMTDQELYRRLGMGGRQLVEGSHSPELEAATYLRLYEEILAGRG